MEGVGMKNKLKGISIVQNEQEFIIGKMSIQEILRFTRYTERLIIGYDEDEIPIYNNRVQRKVESSRVNKIADYLINDKEATFPTNIVLGVPVNIIEEQKNQNDLITIVLQDKVAEQVEKYINGKEDADIFITIIDGQHRIRGIEIAIERLLASMDGKGDILNAEEIYNNLLKIELVVSYFIDKSLEYQAMIFSTINRTQKRVSQDLVLSLFGLSSSDTPYKTALEVVLALNGHRKSPFYKRIRLYGGSYERYSSPPLSQATMIKNIVALISESLRESENDKYKSRKELLNRTNSKKLPFRQFYANNQDGEISDSLFYFYNSIRKYLSQYWEYDGKSTPRNILQSTIGFEALLQLLASILNKNNDITSFKANTFDKFVEKLLRIEFNNFPMTTKSKKRLYLEMYISVFQDSEDVSKQQRDLEDIRIKNAQ
jgi:DGQHR domain-containing protein